MTRTLTFVAIGLMASMAALEALACEGQLFPMSEVQNFETPIKMGASCSFSDQRPITFGSDFEEFEVGSVTGGASVDRGNGMVAQRITDGVPCLVQEKLFVVDCSSGEMVLIDGVQPPDFEGIGWSKREIKYIQRPLGPLEVTKDSSVPDLVEKAAANGLEVDFDVAEFFAQVRMADRYDAACGCKLFYPDSSGARWKYQ